MTEHEKISAFGDLVDQLWKIAKVKGFDKEEIIKPTCIIACSEQMETAYGDELKAMDKIIKLCKQNDDGEKFLQEVLLLAGIK